MLTSNKGWLYRIFVRKLHENQRRKIISPLRHRFENVLQNRTYICKKCGGAFIPSQEKTCFSHVAEEPVKSTAYLENVSDGKFDLKIYSLSVKIWTQSDLEIFIMTSNDLLIGLVLPMLPRSPLLRSFRAANKWRKTCLGRVPQKREERSAHFRRIQKSELNDGFDWNGTRRSAWPIFARACSWRWNLAF